MKFTDMAYKIEGKAFRIANRALRAHPSSWPYISGDAFRALADHVLDADSEIDPRDVRTGDLVMVAAHELPRFAREALPGIEGRFVLLTHNSDWNIDASRMGLADDPRVARWFAQNCLCEHPKIVNIPIGLENRWRHNNGITGDYRALEGKAVAKRARILYGFSVGTNEKERAPALESLRRAKGADECVWTNSRSYRRTLNGYCFVASPPGNGVDCHRTWEALYLGTVPIVKRSALYEGFPWLPALAIDDWKEIEDLDEQRLRDLYRELSVPPRRLEPLWMGYWSAAIEAARRAAASGPGTERE
jgi:hypothetical protein